METWVYSQQCVSALEQEVKLLWAMFSPLVELDILALPFTSQFPAREQQEYPCKGFKEHPKLTEG